MCGIYGTLGKNYRNIESLFSNGICHRGPDDNGIFFDDDIKVTLGHSRLSIIDLSSHAHQPMMSNDGNFILIFNGEIYNYRELKSDLLSLGYNFTTNSDTEVIHKSYMEFGSNCINQFRGMFSFCIYDKKKKEFFLSRDRFGIKPLIYTFLDDQFIFSSELKPFLRSNFISKKLSHYAVSQYFLYGSVKQPNTMLEGVYQLMPGHCMTVKMDRSYKISKYYDFIEKSKQQPKIDNYDEAVAKVREELEISTKYHMVADVEVGAFLSGGVDSTAVVAMMKHYSDKQINTFSVGFKNKTNIEDETDVATRTANYLGCNHHNIKIDGAYVENIFDGFIDAIDQPSIDGINTYIVSCETAKNMKVALSGLGGDEIFAGYPHFKTIIEYSNKKNGIVSFFGQRLNSLRPNRFTNKYAFMGVSEEVALDLQRTIKGDLYKILKKPVVVDNGILPNFMSPIQKISISEINNYMLNTLLRDNDVLSMAHSLEVRPVLLDHTLVELALSLQDNFKIRNGFLKSVFIDSVKDIIPNEVWKRKKTGFEMPLEIWLNDNLNKKFSDAVYYLNSTELICKSQINSLKYRIKNRSARKSDWSYFVFSNWLMRQDILI